mgnify:CR=1 FL=1
MVQSKKFILLVGMIVWISPMSNGVSRILLEFDGS